mgnify:FL=1
MNCFAAGFGGTWKFEHKGGFQTFVGHSWKTLFRGWVEEEDCVKWTMLYLGNLISEVEIRETLRQSYRLASDSDFGSTSLYKPEQLQSLKMRSL